MVLLSFVKEVADQALNKTAADIDAFVAEAWVLEPAKTLAMQIAALKPQYTSCKEVSTDYIEREKRNPDDSDHERSQGIIFHTYVVNLIFEINEALFAFDQSLLGA